MEIINSPFRRLLQFSSADDLACELLMKPTIDCRIAIHLPQGTRSHLPSCRNERREDAHSANLMLGTGQYMEKRENTYQMGI